MKKMTLALLAVATLAGCGSQSTLPMAAQGASSIQAQAASEAKTVQRLLKAEIAALHPGLTIKSLVATRDKEAGVALYSFEGAGTYKGEKVTISGAYFHNQKRISFVGLYDQNGNLIAR